jgi:hypothetical protein
MTWTPTPPGEIPSPDVILGHLAPAPTEGPEGYITPEDLAAIVSALMSTDAMDRADLSQFASDFLDFTQAVGDVSLVDVGVPEHDLVHWLIELAGRVAALEALAGSDVEVPVAEASLEVDMYGGSFVRLRDTAGVLADGELHIVNTKLATVAGPGGEVIQPNPGVPAGNSGVWFDNNGSLGGVVGATGTPITQTTLRNWVKYPDQYLQWVSLDVSGEHPVLTVSKVGSF